jgi:hypothetical protein
VELSQPFVAELIPNMAQEISAPGFSIQEFPILVLRELEMSNTGDGALPSNTAVKTWRDWRKWIGRTDG